VHEVVDRRALLEELGAGDVRELGLVAADRSPGAGRDRALHHQGVLRAGGQSRNHRLHTRQVGVAGIGRGSVDAAEQQAAVLQHLSHIRREVQAVAVSVNELRQARLVDRQAPTAAQELDLLGIHVHGVDGVPELGKARCAHEADPANPDDADRRLFVRVHGRWKLVASRRTRAGTSRWRASGFRRATAKASC
jgi:hypothetical protein